MAKLSLRENRFWKNGKSDKNRLPISSYILISMKHCAAFFTNLN
jgi:hypothetical protein